MDLNSEALPGEVLGKTCADGGTCHHRCDERALRPELNLQPGRCFRRECCAPFSDYSGPWAYDKPEEAMPVITARFHVEHNGVIGSTDAPVKRVEKNDDGSLTVVIDYWPQPQDSAGELNELRAEIARLNGLMPEAPPRPPEGDGLPRYGLRWNGPGAPLSVPMSDGYWTPWHLADDLSQMLKKLDLERSEQWAARRDTEAKLDTAQAVSAELRAELETVALIKALKELLPDLDDALEDLEIWGRHSDQGYRKLKDWYRKILLSTKQIDSTLAAVKADPANCLECNGSGEVETGIGMMSCDTCSGSGIA